ncbi:MAG: hypothetical protein CMN33_01160 [Saprospirales bacterium]|nr:hypothetical protein [Saprospirales bacterium]|tara:strand:+ start:1036 stop:1251 length:216 start_codon:yes stop_codon:yes gene_type:complete
MADDNDFEITYTPPTEEELYEMFCYEMFLRHKDEKLDWEGKVTNLSSTDYKNNNKSFLDKEFKRLRKKGNL